MVDRRSHFHSELESLEQAVLDVVDRTERMVAMSVDALARSDSALASRVESDAAELDRRYFEDHARWINIMARQQPMGGDLRLMSVLLHLNVTLERTASQCVNIAKLARLSEGLPTNESIIQQVQEMGDLVRPMIRTAAHAFARRDADEARLLPAMDEPVDRINRNMYREVVECGSDPQLLEWATHMLMAARAVERVGDQAVDMAEQVVFLVTGEFHEFQESSFAGRSGDG